MKAHKFSIENLNKIQYIEYDFKGQKIMVKPKQLQPHQNEILKALDIDIKVAKK